jgi:hypothetical protein
VTDRYRDDLVAIVREAIRDLEQENAALTGPPSETDLPPAMWGDVVRAAGLRLRDAGERIVRGLDVVPPLDTLAVSQREGVTCALCATSLSRSGPRPCVRRGRAVRLRVRVPACEGRPR